MYPRGFKIIYTLVASLLLLVWLEQKSISFYWQQSYHQDSPVASLEQSPVWQQGQKLNDGLMAMEDGWLTSLSQFHEQTISLINANLLQITEKTNPPDEVLVAMAEDTQVSVSDAPKHAQSNEIVLQKGDKVFFVGDSLMQGVAPHVRSALYNKYGIESIDLSKQSTGLAYINFFNWPKLVEDTFKENQDIRLMVVFLGPNDPWDFSLGKGQPYLKFKSEEWEQIYRSRVKEIIQTAQANNARVLWLGVPNMKKNKLNDGMIYLSELFLSEVKNSKESYLPTNEILGCNDDQFANFVEVDGKNIKVRIDDGIHFTVAGQKLIAQKVLSSVQIKQEHLPENKSDEEKKLSNHS